MKNINLKERIKNSKKVTKAALALALVGATGISMFAGVKLFAATNSNESTETTKEKVVYTFTSKSKPEEILGKLKAGKEYKIREIKAPEGYKKLDKDIDFTVNTDGKLQEIKIANEKLKEEPEDKPKEDPKEDPKEEHKNGFAKTGIPRNFIFSILVFISAILGTIIFYKKRKNQDN